MARQIDRERKRMLVAYRKGHPRLARNFHQRVVAAAKHRHKRRPTTRELQEGS